MSNAIELELQSRGFSVQHHSSNAPQGKYILYIQECVCCSGQNLEWDEDDEEAVEPEPDYEALPFFVYPDDINTREDLSSILGIYSCGGHYSNIRIGRKDDTQVVDITQDILGHSNKIRDDIIVYSL